MYNKYYKVITISKGAAWLLMDGMNILRIRSWDSNQHPLMNYSMHIEEY